MRFKTGSKIAPDVESEWKAGEDIKIGSTDLKVINQNQEKELAAEKEKVPTPKNLMANETLFSEGVASYFYDIMAPLLEESYSTEAKASFTEFGGVEGNGNKEINESDYIEKAVFKTKIEENWKNFLGDYTPEDYFYMYTSGYKRDKIYEREFLFMQVELVSKNADVNLTTGKALLADTVKKINEFFKIADCNEAGYITAE